MKTFKFSVLVRRNYYGEIQVEKRVIEGENYDMARIEFNRNNVSWYVIKNLGAIH